MAQPRGVVPGVTVLDRMDTLANLAIAEATATMFEADRAERRGKSTLAVDLRQRAMDCLAEAERIQNALIRQMQYQLRETGVPEDIPWALFHDDGPEQVTTSGPVREWLAAQPARQSAPAAAAHYEPEPA